MGLKPTNIHSNFFPSRSSGGAPQYSTEDAAPAPAIDAATGDGAAAAGTGLEKVHSNENIILVDWDGPDDPENPMNWPMRRKWTNASLLCLMCLTIGLATAEFSSGIGEMTQELGTSNEIGQVGMLVFNGAFAIVPLFLGPLSEFIGSRPVYLVSMFFFVVWFILLALAQNIGSIIVGRFLSGCSGAARVTLIPGTIANIFSPRQSTIPIACFSFVAVFGTVAGPLIGNYILAGKGWRWIQWVQLIINGAVFLLLLVFLRENRGSVLLTRRAKKLRKETGDSRYRSAAEIESPSLKAMLHASTTRAGLLLVREPVVLAFSLWLAFCWSLIFASFALIPIVYGPGGHGWSTGNQGLAYIGPIIGCIIAFGSSFYWKRQYERSGTIEGRLYGGAFGGILCTVGLFITSFTSYSYLFWIGPQFGLALVLWGIYHIFESVQAYLSDAYGEYASSAISAQGFVRNAMAASFPLFSRQLFTNLHVWGGGLLLSCLLLVAIPLPFILIKYGESIRAKSPYAAASTGIKQGGGVGGDEENGALDGPVQGARRSRKMSRKPSTGAGAGESTPASGAQTRVATPEPASEKKQSGEA